MKYGKSLQDLAIELDRQLKSKKDFVAPVARMKAVATIERGAPIFGINLEGAGFFPMTKLANTQLATYTGIPSAYFKRMETEAPGLLAVNVNRWLEDQANKGERRLARTLDGNLRALLSDKFPTCYDNYDMAGVIIPMCNRLNLEVISADITETKFYIKAVDKAAIAKIPNGKKLGEGHDRIDLVAPGLLASNSEVGQGRLLMESGVWTLKCTNMANFGAKVSRMHIGSKADMSDDVYAMLSDSTKAKTAEAFWSQVTDVVQSAFSPEAFKANCDRLVAATQDEIVKPVTEVLEVVQERYGWNDTETASVLQHLIEGGDLTRYGLHSAVTRMSADVESYDRASELERQGGQIIELPRSDWMKIAA